MNQSDPHRSDPRQSDPRRPRRTLAVILGTLALAGLAVASFGSFAGAADDTTPSTAAPDGTVRTRPQLTDEQKQCLADHGVTPQQKPADGTRPTPPTDEQRARAARSAGSSPACGNTSAR